MTTRLRQAAARPGLAAAASEALLRSEQRIVITGASGWLGSATIDLLHSTLGERLAGRLFCFGSSARTLFLRDGLSVEQRPLAEIADLPPQPTLVLHLAFLTKDRVEGMNETAYRTANEAVSATVLNALDAIGTTAVFVASSGAARQADNPAADHAMRLYGSMKKRDEEDFSDWALQYARTAVITRVFNVSGPYINKYQSYALAAFINDALSGQTVQVRAPHRVIRGFVAIRELMSLVLCLMLEPQPRIVSFDTGGDPLELGEVAAIVAETLDRGDGVGAHRADISSERVDRYHGDPTDYDRLRGEFAIDSVSFPDQVLETADYMIAARGPDG